MQGNMKVINRDKFELIGYNRATKNMTPKGLVYNCTKNKAKCNLLEYLWFSSEWMVYRKANIFWMLLFIICPWYDQLYYSIKKHEINFNLTIGELLSLILMVVITLSGLGFVFTILFSIRDIRKSKKEFLAWKPEEELYKMGERTIFE